MVEPLLAAAIQQLVECFDITLPGAGAPADWLHFNLVRHEPLADTLDTGEAHVILKHMINNLSDAELDLVFHAIADPTRRRIVERLTSAPATVSELAEPFAISLPAVLQHLHVLEASGVVRTEKVGRVRMCRFEPSVVRAAERWMVARRTDWELRLDRLGEHLVDDHFDTEPEETS